MEESTV